MDWEIHQIPLRREWRVPPSKSLSLRALLFSELGQAESCIENLLRSPDVDAMQRACMVLGECGEVDVGNSGIVLRFMTALYATGEKEVKVTGDESICTRRSMRDLGEGLSQMGAKITYLEKEGFAPLIVKGPIRRSKVVVEGRDSQVVSALLIAGSLTGIDLTAADPGELPWVDMTLDWLKRVGVSVEREGYHHYSISRGHAWNSFSYTVPGDWSSAAFPLVAAAITRTPLTLQGLQKQDTQGDCKILSILQQTGITFSWRENNLFLYPSAHLKSFCIDIADCIDALPILCVLACFTEGKSTLHSIAMAREKESDRVESMVMELTKMGAQIEDHGEALAIYPSKLRGATVSSHNDHRVAMALAVAGLTAEGTTIVKDVTCVDKTFPNFAQQLNVEETVGI